MSDNGENGVPFLDRVIHQILKYAGPFETITGEARGALDAYLNEEVTIGGLTVSREAHCQVEATCDEFFERLAFVGAYACEEGLKRIGVFAANGMTAVLALTKQDLITAEQIVSIASATGLCNPD